MVNDDSENVKDKVETREKEENSLGKNEENNEVDGEKENSETDNGNESDSKDEENAESNENNNKSDHKKSNKLRFWSILSIVAFASVFLLVLLAPSIEDYFHNQTHTNMSTSYWYNGFLFNSTRAIGQKVNTWRVGFRVGKQVYFADFYFDPRSLENITLPKEVNHNLLDNRSQIYITTAPDTPSTMAIIFIELGKITGTRSNRTIYGLYGIPTNMTLTNNSDYPSEKQITCANATNSTLVIWLNYGLNNSDSVSYKDNCLILSSNNATYMLKQADRIDYALLGIMK